MFLKTQKIGAKKLSISIHEIKSAKSPLTFLWAVRMVLGRVQLSGLCPYRLSRYANTLLIQSNGGIT